MWLFQAQEEQHRQRVELRRGGVSSSSPSSSSYAEQQRQLKAAMEQSELKRRIIFDSIYSPELCRDGILLMDELSAVISHARSVWSSALWEWTKESAVKVGGIRRTVSLVRDTFLGSRGDLWKSFVENCFPAVLPSAYSRRTPGRLEREVPDAFRKALHTCHLRDNALYDQVRLIVLPRENSGIPLDYSFQGVGRTVMSTISRIQLNASLSTSTEMILFPQAASGGGSNPSSNGGLGDQVELYDRLFTHQLSLQFALHALLECRLLLRDITVQTGIRVGHRDDAQSLLNHITLVLTHYVYFLQVDVFETNFQRMIDRLEAEEEPPTVPQPSAAGAGGAARHSLVEGIPKVSRASFEDRVGEALNAAQLQQYGPQETTAATVLPVKAFGGDADPTASQEGEKENTESASMEAKKHEAHSSSPHSPSSPTKPTFASVNRPASLQTPTGAASATAGTLATSNRKKVKPCTSLPEAQRVHTEFLRTVVTGCFLGQHSEKKKASRGGGGGSSGNHDVREAVEATMRCTFTLYALLSNTGVRGEIEAHKMGKETQDVLQELMRCIQLEVFPSLTRHLSVSTNSAHRALWVRLDFNQWLSKRK